MEGYIVNYTDADECLKDRLISELNHYSAATLKLCIKDNGSKKTCWTGAWTQRWIVAGLELGFDPIFKLDPDTRMHRSINGIPKADYFGTLSDNGKFIRGGCVGISGSVAHKIIQSGFLLREFEHGYQRYGEFQHAHEEFDPVSIACHDRILGEVMAELGISPTRWEDINILARGIPQSEAMIFTHPHPLLTEGESSIV